SAGIQGSSDGRREPKSSRKKGSDGTDVRKNSERGSHGASGVMAGSSASGTGGSGAAAAVDERNKKGSSFRKAAGESWEKSGGGGGGGGVLAPENIKSDIFTQQAQSGTRGETHQQQHSLRYHYQRRSKDELGGITRRNLDGHAAGEDDGRFSQVENTTPFARDLRMNCGRRYSTSPVRTNTYSSVPVQIERDTVAPSPTFGMRAFDATLVNRNPPLHLGPTSEGQYQR
ncbi:unnamed protein product, partial [Ascophyllum nodosum]